MGQRVKLSIQKSANFRKNYSEGCKPAGFACKTLLSQANTFPMKSVAVFCGSAKGADPIYASLADALGALLARRGITLVYGAGNIGLMGAVADGALRQGGHVVGSIPHFIKEKEVCHTGLSELFTVDSMHERKQLMAERSEGFIILPGGFGTLDEFFEILTWKQLKLHYFPIGILNWKGFYDHLLAHIEHLIQEGFVKPEFRKMFIVEEDAAALLDKMQVDNQELGDKWLEKS